MKVTLLFPPATDPRGPHLALPALAAYLRKGGVEVVQKDLDLEGLLGLLSVERLQSSIRGLQSDAGDRPDQGRRSELLPLTEGLVERVEQALRIIRDPIRFFHANDLSAARATIDTAVAVASCAAAAPLTYSLEPIRYDVEGFDARRLDDLIRVTGLPATNLFHEIWEDEVLPLVEVDDPDLVGISLANRQQMIPGLTLARRLKERGRWVVLGGTLITKFADGLLRWPEFFTTFADAVVVYEGETAFGEIVEQLEGGRDFRRVPNLRYLDGDEVRATMAHVEEVDVLPTPDFGGLPLGDYLAPRPVLPILFGKGCYHSGCRFCDIPHINQVSLRRRRLRDPQTVVADVKRLEERCGARHFVVTDDSLAPDVLCEVADAFGADQGRYSFTGYARLEPGFTNEACERIAALGFRKLLFGFESAAQRTLDHMAKGTRAADAAAVLRACREAGISFHIFSMIGLPEEDEASALETFEFLIDHREIIDHPGNSFDIHRFGLDVRARYFAEQDQLGLSVDPEVCRQEFVVSLSHRDWENTRGLSRERIGELLDEFNQSLRMAFGRYHNAPRHLWPPFEEHAVLYADHYRMRPFPFASALPNGERVALRLSPASVWQGDGDNVTLTSYWSSVALPASLVGALADVRARTVDELVRDCVSAPPGKTARAERLVRDLVWNLLGKGMVQLELPDGEGLAMDEPPKSSDKSA
jgi:hypothetical protein